MNVVALTNRQQQQHPEAFVYAFLILERYGIESDKEAQSSVEIGYILLDWPQLCLRLMCGFCASRRLGPRCGYEDKDVRCRYEGSHAEEAEELGLDWA